MAVINCPECGNKLIEAGVRYRCETCRATYEIDFTCAECGNPPELLAGCGSTSYFCSTCNSLRSRGTMDKAFRKVESPSD